MRRLAKIAMLLGITVMIIVILREGARDIATLLARAGWILLCLVPLHALPLLPDAIGWRALIAAQSRVRVLYLIAAVRQAVNRLLPVANIGGEIVGVRLLARTGVDGSAAAASVIVEVLVTLASQCLFVALGLLVLLRLTGAVRLVNGISAGLAALLAAIVLLGFLLRHGSLFSRLQRMSAKLLQDAGAAELGAGVDSAVRTLCSSYGRLSTALVWQMIGFLSGCIQVWAALRWLGKPVTPAEALVLESLSQAARQLVFVVPGGFGVQEVSLLTVGQLLGVDSEAAIALSLAKRMAEIVFGVPALIYWQWIEGLKTGIASRVAKS